MVWRRAATVVLDVDGRYVDADEAALDLLGVETVEELRATHPDRFAAIPPDPAEQEAWRRAYFASAAEGVLAEGTFRRIDGELVRVRTAIMAEADGRFRALFYPVERPTTNLGTRVYRIADVLQEWRAAERRLVEVESGTPEADRLLADIEALRDQYHTMFQRGRRDHP